MVLSGLERIVVDKSRFAFMNIGERCNIAGSLARGGGRCHRGSVAAHISISMLACSVFAASPAPLVTECRSMACVFFFVLLLLSLSSPSLLALLLLLLLLLKLLLLLRLRLFVPACVCPNNPSMQQRFKRLIKKGDYITAMSVARKQVGIAIAWRSHTHSKQASNSTTQPA